MEQVRGGPRLRVPAPDRAGDDRDRVDAIKRGAFDYISKRRPAAAAPPARAALERLSSRRELFRLRRVLQNEGWFDSMIGDSPRMSSCTARSSRSPRRRRRS